MVVAVIVHPIDTEKHPTIPAGFRWCAQFGTNPIDASQYLNAGWEPSINDASVTGEMVASSIYKAFRIMSIECDYLGVIQLADDPIPAEEI